jgi:RNA:NAD 2'-phosphotransferase (TPT1/KptA family)
MIESMTSITEIPFGCPSEHNDYSPFPENFGINQQLLFHGTSEERAISIINNGFNPMEQLSSSSFTTHKGLALSYACSKRHKDSRGAVLAVSFETLDTKGIRNEGEFVYLDDHAIQPKIIAVCYVPHSYKNI